VAASPEQVVERFVAAIASGDERAMAALLAEDVTGIDRAAALDIPPRTHGRQAALASFRHLRDAAADFHRENDEYLTRGDWVIAVGRWIATGNYSKLRYERPTVNAMRIRDGQIAELVMNFADRRSALAYVERR
jgi:ketosteroid isomerase-like protein